MLQKRQWLVYLFVFGLMAGVTVNASAQSYEILWATSPAGGVFPVLGAAMLDDIMKAYPSLKSSTLPLGGAANLMALNEGKANIAFSLSDSTGDAWDGIEVFKPKGPIRNIRELVGLFPEPTHFVVLADSGITDVKQLKGKRVTPSSRGTAIEIATKRILDAYGMSYKDMRVTYLSFTEASVQFIDGHIDAILYGAAGYPHPSIVDVCAQRKVRFLSLSEEVIAKLSKTVKGVFTYTIPPGSYQGVDYPVRVISTLANIVVREDMPEIIAYDIVKTIAENLKRYTVVTKMMSLVKPEDMAKDIGIPFHPGALRYYKEKGWIK